MNVLTTFCPGLYAGEISAVEADGSGFANQACMNGEKPTATGTLSQRNLLAGLHLRLMFGWIFVSGISCCFV
jgi:hypothetical protein